jgi:integrase
VCNVKRKRLQQAGGLMKLTTANIAALRLAEGEADRIVFDDDIPGFGLRARASGTQTWIFQYKRAGQTRRLTLGNVAALKVAKARDIASDLHARVRLGGDPVAEKRASVDRARHTFKALTDRFIDSLSVRERTKKEIARHLHKYASTLHSRPVDNVELRDIAELLSSLEKNNGAVTSNRVRSTLSQCFAWGMREGLVQKNPVINTNKRDEKPRDRVLSNAELQAIWRAADDVPIAGNIIRLLILTGQRLNEIAQLRRSEVDLVSRAINLPKERTKNHRAHQIPLSDMAMAILSSIGLSEDLIFNGRGNRPFGNWSYAKELLDKHSGVSHWVIHDIRRSVATGMADIGVAPHIIEAVLNHISGHKGGVAGIYNRSSYSTEKVEALARWGRHVASIVEA